MGILRRLIDTLPLKDSASVRRSLLSFARRSSAAINELKQQGVAPERLPRSPRMRREIFMRTRI